MFLNFYFGYYGMLIGNVMLGFGYVGLGGLIGWIDLEIGVVFVLVYNWLLLLLVMIDYVGFVGIYYLIW